jgi:hypothetical protein
MLRLVDLAEGSIGRSAMCDYSPQGIKTRPAKVGDRLMTRDFGTGTQGFAASEDVRLAACVLAGTELAFAHKVERLPIKLWPWHDAIEHKTAILRQINKDKLAAHHDALEFLDGHIVLLSSLREGQQTTILQLSAEPRTIVETEAQRRVAYARPVREAHA